MTDTSNDALRNCPFCGGDNVETFGPYGWYRQWGIGHMCKSFYNGSQEMFQGFLTEAEAIAAWNTRQPDDRLRIAEAAKPWVVNLEWHKPAHRAVMASVKLGAWMSAALDDPNICAEMKADIEEWFSAGEPMEELGQALTAALAKLDAASPEQPQ